MIREVEKNFEGGLAVQSEVLKQSKKRACMGIGSASDGTYLTTVPMTWVFYNCGFGLAANTTTFGGHQGVPKVSCQQAKSLDHVCGAQLQRPPGQCLPAMIMFQVVGQCGPQGKRP